MTTAIVCQRCGAPLPTPGDSPFVACSYCGTTHVVSAPRAALPPRAEGPDELTLRRQAIDRAWDEAVAHGKSPLVALRAVVFAQSGALADEAEAERAARLAESLLRAFDAENGTTALPAKGRGDKNVTVRVAEGAVRAIVELRRTTETEVNLPFLHATTSGPLHLSRRLTRGDLEALDRGGALEAPVVAVAASAGAAAPPPPASGKRWWWPFG